MRYATPLSNPLIVEAVIGSLNVADKADVNIYV